VTTASVEMSSKPARPRSFVDRVLGAMPVVALACVVLVFYAVEAWTRKTPWIFTDELEWTQLSRSIAETGHAARRGQPIYFKSLYAWVIAPFWWIHSTTTAYAAIKYANAVLMCLAAVPAYLLARMLVSRTGAVLVAVGSVAIPGMAYATSIVPDVIAYPYFVLCSWLAVRALRSQRRWDVVIALAFLFGGYLVHQRQFTALPVAFLVAGLGLWLTGPRFRALSKNWSRGDWIGVAVLVAGSLMLFNRVVLQHISEWQLTTQYDKPRMVDLGLRAALSLTIGLGVLPVIGGLSSLYLPDRRGDRTYCAYVAWTGTIIATVGLYTALKVAYLSTTYATLWEERDLIPLSPILLLGTVMVFESKRVSWWAIGASTAFVLAMVLFKAIQTIWPYYEAPGSAIPGILVAYRHWDMHSLRLGLLGVTAVSLALIALRRRPVVAAVTAVLALAWMLSGEIAMTYGLDNGANAFRANLPPQLTWVDAASHGQPVTYVGQEIRDPNGENLTEFWNRSITRVDSLDGSAPGPGPAGTANLLSPDGALSGLSGVHYVLADLGVNLVGKIVAQNPTGAMRLYHGNGDWHLLDAVQQVYDDGWCPNWCSYSYFKPGQRGTLQVSIGREGYNGTAPPARVTIVSGDVGVKSQTAVMGRVTGDVHRVVPNLSTQTVNIPVEKTPVRVELTTAPSTLIPPSASDNRHLGVQVGFKFVPARK
jgi:hypothetical protein